MADATKLQGWEPDWSDAATRRQALLAAVDYRGDVTLRLADGSEITGYVFNVRWAPGGEAEAISLYTKLDDAPQTISAAKVAGLTFSGRDTAEGKTWEAWLAKVADAEASGKIAELYPEQMEA